jgi:hypothetical protein
VFSRTCVCGRKSRDVPLNNAWDVLAAAAELTAEGWRRDAKDRTLCPDCGDKAGIPVETGFVSPPAPRRSKKAALLAILLAASPAASHDWYPPACCSDRDCRPSSMCTTVDGKEGVEVAPDVCQAIDWNVAQPSPDGRTHVCVLEWRDVGAEPSYSQICVFLPGEV